MAVAQCFDSVCPMGQPWSHSTHAGFSAPPTSSLSGRLLPWAPLLPDFQSLAVGVGHFAHAAVSASRNRPLIWLCVLLFAPPTNGVGNRGEAPPPIADVRRSDIRRGKLSVAPGISTRHQVGDDDVPASGSDERAVFKEDPGRSNSVNCSHDFAVEAASLASNACALSSRADVLTREASADCIDASQLSREVHGSDIALDDSKAGELLAQDLAGVGVPLDSDDGLVTEDEVGKDAAACTGEEMSSSHVTPAPCTATPGPS